jgi:L-ascorbate metabolism protein UlaG (beta-lactamase superfamily)
MPAEFQKPPTDADLILVTHGHFDHSSSAPAILAASTKPDCKIVTIKEIGQYYQTKCQVDPSRIQFMNKSGTKDFGWCRVTMVGADHHRIVEEARRAIRGHGKRGRVPKYWDGRAAGRIVELLLRRK